MRALIPVLLCLTLFAPVLAAQELEGARNGEETEEAIAAVPSEMPAAAAEREQEVPIVSVVPKGDAQRGRLVFGPCRTCHYPQAVMGHNNGPSLHRIFGKVVGKQAGFDYYSPTFKAAEFVWTPRLMFAWLENPMAMYPESTMMSLGVPDPQDRADLIAYLEQASVRDP